MKHLLKYAIMVAGVFLIVFLVIKFNARDKKFSPLIESDQKVREIEEVKQINLESKTNSEGLVSVIVSPKNVSDVAEEWEFEIMLDTHSVELSDNLTQNSVLLNDNDKEYAPTSWDGDPAGGHHRKGVLKFAAINPLPRSITLKIRNIGDVAERNFSWQIQ